MNLRIPGPTPCPPDVLAAVGRQMMNHRGPEVAELTRRVVGGLRPFFRTESDIILLTASGTAGLEAAIVNTLSPGDPVLAVTTGVFGDRFAEIAEGYGADVTRLSFEWGTAVDPAEVSSALAEKRFRAVLLTHNETSTGVTSPLGEICESIHARSGPLLLVDAISSLGALPLATDALGLDVVVTGSQKAWGVPPGMAMLSVSERAWHAASTARIPRFYLDLERYRAPVREGQFPWTPSLPVLYGLEVALERMRLEGEEAIYARHARVGAHTRAAVSALGLELFADPRFASNTVTAVRVPEGIDGKALTRTLRERHATVVGGGQGKLTGKIFRLGHLGFVTVDDVDQALFAVSRALRERK